VKEKEWMEVGAWVYDNFDYMSGVSFLPFTDHVYKQAPYQDCTEEEYNEFLKKMPKDVDWGILSKYESTDTTIASQELACGGQDGNGCDITFTPTGVS
jgi:ribonucleoside-diphosphate reductase alpha chain